MERLGFWFYRFTRSSFNRWLLAGFLSFVLAIPVSATDCIVPVPVPAAWESKFPFDLIYPINQNMQPVDWECLDFNLWGFQKDMCSISMIIPIVKNVFLFRLVVDAIINL